MIGGETLFLRQRSEEIADVEIDMEAMKQRMEEDLEDDLANEHYYYNEGTPGSINYILFIYISKDTRGKNDSQTSEEEQSENSSEGTNQYSLVPN